MERQPTPEEYFKCFNGKTLKNIQDLKDELQLIIQGKNTENFSHHVTPERNDYATWLQNVFMKKRLAARVQSKRKPEDILRIINEYDEPKKKVGVSNRDKTGESVEEQKEEIRPVNVDKAEALLEKVKAMKAKTKAGTPETIQEKISFLKEKLEALKQEITDARKNGKDMLIPSLLIKNVPPKISYYEASREQSDYHSAERLLADIKKEVDEALAQKEPDLKSEVMKGAGLEIKKDDD
jgi:hypothetical protein